MSESLVTSPTPSDDNVTDAVPFRMTHRQASALIASTIIGIGVLTLPRSTAEYAAQNGWISTLLGALMAMVALSFITMLIRRHPGLHMVEIAKVLFSFKGRSWTGLLLSLPFLLSYVVYWTSGAALSARIFGEVVTTTVLKRTPLEVIIVTMLITAYILVIHDVEVLIRVNEVLLPLIVIPLLLIGLSSLQSAQIVNMLPLFHIDIGAFLKGTMLTATSYLGFELLMIFGAVSMPEGNPMPYHFMGIAIAGLVYSLIVFSGIAVFGVDELKFLAWPTLELVKTTEVPGLILERVESAFLGVWVAAVFTTLGNLSYGISLLIKEMLGLRSHKLIALMLVPVVYWISLQAPNVQSLFMWVGRWNILGMVNSAAIPLLFLLLSFLRKPRPPKAAASKAPNQPADQIGQPDQGG